MDEQIIALLKETRQNFHKYPEVSGQEFETQKRIIDFLEKQTSVHFDKIATTGVLACFDSGKDGKCLMIRGDIDALPIQETNHFSHRSVHDGVSHKCGHDGHTTILLGLAMELSKRPIKQGKVYLLFQPAEENGKGAPAVLEELKEKKIVPDQIYALHNLPGYPKHQIVLKEGAFTCSVQSIIVKLNGKTAHAAEPEMGNNPANAIAKILDYAQNETLNDIYLDQFILFTPVYVNLGEKAYGISAGYGEVHLTIRSSSADYMKEKSEELVQFIEKLCLSEHLIPEIDWTEIFHANLNDPTLVQNIRKAANNLQLSTVERKVPFKWGEDFGILTQHYPGAMFGIGSGENCPALHNPDYDFPDEITPTAVQIFYSIIQEIITH